MAAELQVGISPPSLFCRINYPLTDHDSVLTRKHNRRNTASSREPRTRSLLSVIPPRSLPGLRHVQAPGRSSTPTLTTPSPLSLPLPLLRTSLLPQLGVVLPVVVVGLASSPPSSSTLRRPSPSLSPRSTFPRPEGMASRRLLVIS